MKKTTEKLWNDYLSDECSRIDTEEERNLLEASAKRYEKLTSLLTKEASELLEAYTDTIFEMNSILAKRAFSKGCEFAVSFLIEATK